MCVEANKYWRTKINSINIATLNKIVTTFCKNHKTVKTHKRKVVFSLDQFSSKSNQMYLLQLESYTILCILNLKSTSQFVMQFPWKNRQMDTYLYKLKWSFLIQWTLKWIFLLKSGIFVNAIFSLVVQLERNLFLVY